MGGCRQAIGCGGVIMDRWDIFCRVVDNFGDIGVCWRLARQLAREHRRRVRLWVDDWPTLCHLLADCPAQPASVVLEGVELVPWRCIDTQVRPAKVVIEAFACTLPPAYVDAIAAMSPPPVWICLEYLSAEAWVDGCHRLPSPDPVSGRPRLTFFPGFTPRTGGLLREAALFARRDLSQRAHGRAHWLDRHPPIESPTQACWVSLFAYDTPALAALLAAWQESPEPLLLWVPAGRVLEQISTWFGASPARAGDGFVRGALQLRALPFLPMDEYDTLLALCDVNFVRGEDSFVRAQWAARPFVWHIYPQSETAHRVKLEAFFERYAAGLAPPDSEALHALWLAWNGWGDVATAWPRVHTRLAELSVHARRWCDMLALQDDLAKQLVNCARLALK